MKKILCIVLTLISIQGLISLQGCEKAYTTVDFTFIDYFTLKPIENLKVNITKQGDAGSFILVDSVVTDSTGKAFYVFEIDPGNSFYVSPNKNSAYSPFEDEYLPTGAKVTKSLTLKPWSQLILSMKNSSNTYQSINVTFNTATHGGTGNYIGKFSDTTLTFPHSVPRENVTVTYKLYKSIINSEPMLSLDTTFLTSDAEPDFIRLQK